ncbi:MAG: ABC transporter ATP-binding protein [Pseudomonadota bacterium]
MTSAQDPDGASGASLDVRDVSWSPPAARQPALRKTKLFLDPGRILGVVGPNGAGKTTFLRLIYRYYRPATGSVLIDGEDIWQMPARSVAQKVAAVLQEQPTDFALTVREIVALGRTPHRRGFGGDVGARDAEIIRAALENMDLKGFEDRQLGSLSGGERQRIMVARALAQEPKLLILDEPTNHLDIRHQLEIIEMIRGLSLTIVTSLHDLNVAASVCDDILLLKEGQPLQVGPPSTVLSETIVSDAFQVMAFQEKLSPSQSDHLTFHLQNKGQSP